MKRLLIDEALFGFRFRQRVDSKARGTRVPVFEKAIGGSQMSARRASWTSTLFGAGAA